MSQKTEKIKMTKEDRAYFAAGMKTANPIEFLVAAAFVKDNEAVFDKADLKFMHSHMGRRAERLLRNVVNNFSFEDKPDTGGKGKWEIN